MYVLSVLPSMVPLFEWAKVDIYRVDCVLHSQRYAFAIANEALSDATAFENLPIGNLFSLVFL